MFCVLSTHYVFCLAHGVLFFLVARVASIASIAVHARCYSQWPTTNVLHRCIPPRGFFSYRCLPHMGCNNATERLIRATATAKGVCVSTVEKPETVIKLIFEFVVFANLTSTDKVSLITVCKPNQHRQGVHFFTPLCPNRIFATLNST